MTRRETEAADALAAQVGCEIEEDFGDFYHCRLLRAGGELGVRLVEERFTRTPDTTELGADEAMAEVNCVVDGRSYLCLEPFLALDTPLVDRLETRRYLRPLLELFRNRRWSLERVGDVEVRVENCDIAGLGGDLGVTNRLDQGLAFTGAFLDEFVQLSWGGRFIEDFAVLERAVPRCGPRDDGTGRPDDLICRERYFRGGRRHGCERRGEQYLCNRATIDIRRMQVRPEGIEIVLAEGSDDPQGRLLRGRAGGAPGLVPPGSPQAAFATVTPDVCDPGRYRVVEEPDDPDSVIVHELERVERNLFLHPERRICDRDEVGCTGICPEIGTTCSRASTLQLHELLGGGPIPARSTCHGGRCCGRFGAACCATDTPCAEGLECMEGRCR